MSGWRPRRPLKALHEESFAVLAAVAARVVGAPGADPVEIAHAVDEHVSFVPVESRRDFGRSLPLLRSALAGLNKINSIAKTNPKHAEALKRG